MTGTIATTTPLPATGSPSAAGVVIGTPSPDATDLTGIQPVGNSSDFSSSFTDYIAGLEKSAVGAVTGLGNKIRYKGDVVLGTISKQYYQAQAGLYNAVGSTAQVAQNVANKITTTSTLIIVAIIAFIAFPYLMAFTRKK